MTWTASALRMLRGSEGRSSASAGGAAPRRAQTGPVRDVLERDGLVGASGERSTACSSRCTCGARRGRLQIALRRREVPGANRTAHTYTQSSRYASAYSGPSTRSRARCEGARPLSRGAGISACLASSPNRRAHIMELFARRRPGGLPRRRPHREELLRPQRPHRDRAAQDRDRLLLVREDAGLRLAPAARPPRRAGGRQLLVADAGVRPRGRHARARLARGAARLRPRAAAAAAAATTTAARRASTRSGTLLTPAARRRGRAAEARAGRTSAPAARRRRVAQDAVARRRVREPRGVRPRRADGRGSDQPRLRRLWRRLRRRLVAQGAGSTDDSGGGDARFGPSGMTTTAPTPPPAARSLDEDQRRRRRRRQPSLPHPTTIRQPGGAAPTGCGRGRRRAARPAPPPPSASMDLLGLDERRRPRAPRPSTRSRAGADLFAPSSSFGAAAAEADLFAAPAAPAPTPAADSLSRSEQLTWRRRRARGAADPFGGPNLFSQTAPGGLFAAAAVPPAPMAAAGASARAAEQEAASGCGGGGGGLRRGGRAQEGAEGAGGCRRGGGGGGGVARRRRRAGGGAAIARVAGAEAQVQAAVAAEDYAGKRRR